MSVVPFKPEGHRGQKMEARGLLYRDETDARLNLTSLADCSTAAVNSRKVFLRHLPARRRGVRAHLLGLGRARNHRRDRRPVAAATRTRARASSARVARRFRAAHSTRRNSLSVMPLAAHAICMRVPFGGGGALSVLAASASRWRAGSTGETRGRAARIPGRTSFSGSR